MLGEKISFKDEAPAIYAACFVSLLAFLQGMDSTEIAGFTAMVGFLKDFGYYDETTQAWNINTNIQLLITCMVSVGAALGSVIAGPFGTRFGQKLGLMLCALTSMTGSAIQTGATTLGGLVVGRIFVGMGIGMATNYILVYQAEVAPRQLRGVLLGTFSITYTLGGLIGTIINNATQGIDSRWCYRIPLLTQLVCPALFLSCAWMLPESPRFLVSRGRIDDAIHAHRRLHGISAEADELRVVEMQEIVALVEIQRASQKNKSYLDCFRGVDRRRTLIAIGLMTCQNFMGRDFIGSYSTYFFTVAGITDAFKVSVYGNLASLMGAIVAAPLCRYVGRRMLLLPCMAGCFVCLLIFASVGTAMPDTLVAGKVLVAFIIIYYFLFTIALVVVASTMVSESASTNLRFQAQSVAVFFAWGEAVMWTAVLPYLINPSAANLGVKVGFIYGGFGVLCFIFAFFCVPEYHNRSLEELDEMFLKHVPARKFSSFVCTGEINGRTVSEEGAVVKEALVEHDEKAVV
ncbi:hypothetical protein SEUCBS139899_007072 [Sporothrix eucalyptigena]